MKSNTSFYNLEDLMRFYACFRRDLPSRGSQAGEPRWAGRHKIHVENVLFAQWISMNIRRLGLCFPLTVEYSDKPDFRIRDSQKQIGIEITEQSSGQFQKAIQIGQTSDGFIESSDFTYGVDQSSYSNQLLKKIVGKKKLGGLPSMGDQEERHWVKRTLDTSLAKEIKIKKYEGLLNYKNIHLCIFDCGPEHMMIDYLKDEHFNNLYDGLENTVYDSITCIDTHSIYIDVRARHKIIWPDGIPPRAVA